MEYKSFRIEDLAGNAVTGATVNVYETGTTTPAAGLQDFAGEAVTSPLTADAVTGKVGFKAPNGTYDLVMVRGDFQDVLYGVEFFDIDDANIDRSGRYDSVQALLDSTDPARGEGKVWQGGARLFTEAAVGAFDYHEITAGGVGLYEAGDRFTSRERAESGNTLGSDVIYIGDLAFRFDLSGTALISAGGRKWSPAGDVTPQHWGAAGDGVTDDSTAVGAWLDYWLGNDRIGSLPPGDYLLNSFQEKTVGAVRGGIRGAGKGISRFIVPATNTDGGISIRSNTRSSELTFTGFSVITRGAGGVGFRFWQPEGGNQHKRSVELRQVAVRGEDGTNDYFDTFVSLAGTWRPLIVDVQIDGPFVGVDNSTGSNRFAAAVGLDLDGAYDPSISELHVWGAYRGIRSNVYRANITSFSDNGDGTSRVTISNTVAHPFSTGFNITITGAGAPYDGVHTVTRVSNTQFDIPVTFTSTSTGEAYISAGAEAFRMTNTVINGCRFAVDYVRPAGREPIIWIDNCHINYRDEGFRIDGAKLVTIQASHPYNEDNGSLYSGVPYDIHLVNCSEFIITGNTFHFNGHPDRIPVKVEDNGTALSGDIGIISQNLFNCTGKRAVWLVNGCRNIVVGPNNYAGGTFADGLVNDVSRKNTVIDATPINENFATRAEAEARGTSASQFISIGDLTYESDPSGTALTTGDGRTWSPEGVATVKHWGAVDDAALATDRYNGTDLAPFLQAAVDYLVAVKGGVGQIFIPRGDWVIAAVENDSSFAVEFPIGNAALDIEIFGEKGTRIFIDGDETITPSLSGVFGNSDGATAGTTAATLPSSGNGRVKFRDIHFEGVLGKQYAADEERFGPDLFRFGGMDLLSVERTSAKDITNKWSANFGGQRGVARFNTLNNVASDGIRFINYNDLEVTDNWLRYVDDDAIALAINKNYEAGVPARDGIICSRNMVSDSEGILINGGKTLNCCDNIIRRPHGTGLAVTYFDVVAGTTSVANVIISRNQVLDALTRYDPATGAFPAANLDTTAMVVTGAIVSDGGTAIPGYYDSGTGAFLRPYDTVSGQDLSLIYEPDSTSNPIMGGFNILITDNIISRTRSAVAAYSDWGMGTYKFRGGDVDPAVGEDAFQGQALTIGGDIRNMIISRNVVSGFSLHGIRFERGLGIAPNNIIGENILITDNVFEDIGLEIIDTDWKGGSTDYYLGLTISRNVLSNDPYHTNVERNSNGSWATDTAINHPHAIQNRRSPRWIISDNVFRHTVRPVVLPEDAQYRSNTIEGRFANRAFSTSNKGVGVPGSGGTNYHHIKYADPPADGTNYGRTINMPKVQAASMPTSGEYVEGHFVLNNNPSSGTRGWLRLTTGSAHVLATDWKAVPA